MIGPTTAPAIQAFEPPPLLLLLLLPVWLEAPAPVVAGWGIDDARRFVRELGSLGKHSGRTSSGCELGYGCGYLAVI
jgi:hypothetical protein